MKQPILTVEKLSKHYGGILANTAIDFAAHVGEVHAVIGPNGAGKTTFLKQLVGSIQSDAGLIRLNGREVTGLAMHTRSQLGIASTYQLTSIFPSLSTLDNVALAAQAHNGHSFRFWKPYANCSSLNETAMHWLSLVGLSKRGSERADTLSHGEHRLLEIAMALATGPKVLLLDEPAAGLGVFESQALAVLLKQLKRSHALVLVEHDMDIVFDTADRITVLAQGHVIACDTPEMVRKSPRVKDAYLGTKNQQGDA